MFLTIGIMHRVSIFNSSVHSKEVPCVPFVRCYFKLMLVINPSPNIQAAEHPLSAVCYCLFKASVAALCLRMWTMINHLRSVLTASTVAFGIRKCILSTDGLDVCSTICRVSSDYLLMQNYGFNVCILSWKKTTLWWSCQAKWGDMDIYMEGGDEELGTFEMFESNA